MQTNPVARALRYIGLEFVWGILYFPIWWYSTGTKRMLFFIGREMAELTQSLNLKILAKSLFKPMFGDYSREGRIISIFVRFFHLIFLTFTQLVFTIVLVCLFIIWLLLPVAVVYFIFFQLSNYSENHLITLFNAFKK